MTAAARPAGPAPITATLRPLSFAFAKAGNTPYSRAFATTVACTAGMFTAQSIFLCTHAPMHSVSGHTIPQMPPNGFFDMISAAARWKSAGVPSLTAMMKSAGEQSHGQASLQGFSSQNSHFSISARSWASVKIGLLNNIRLALIVMTFLLLGFTWIR